MSDKSTNTLEETFWGYKVELNKLNDTREKIVVLSRQITKDSKRVIFQLHRTVNNSKENVIKRAEQMIKDVRKNISKITNEFEGDSEQNYYRFQKNYGPGLQEYVEAESFLHYQKTGSLISIAEIEALLTEAHPSNKVLRLSVDNYVLGIADLTGELMRLAVNSVGMKDNVTPIQVSEFMNELYSMFVGINIGVIYDLGRKMDTMLQSILKIETVVFEIRLKSMEMASK